MVIRGHRPGIFGICALYRTFIRSLIHITPLAAMAPSTTSNAGIVTDETSGQREIPESTRADGTTRKAIKIRPGFRPAEDIELYRARNARTRGQRTTVPGAASREEQPRVERPTRQRPAVENSPVERPTSRQAVTPTSKSSSRSARSLDWRRRDNAPEEKTSATDTKNPEQELPKEEPEDKEQVDPEVEKQKKARNLKKKLKQAQELKNKRDDGQGLLPEQIAKVIKINELVRELEALGIDSTNEPKKDN